MLSIYKTIEKLWLLKSLLDIKTTKVVNAFYKMQIFDFIK